MSGPEKSKKFDEEFKREAEALFNQLVLNPCGMEIVRLIGYGEDQSDAYAICKNWQNEEVWITYVCFVTPLKGALDDDEYDRWVDMFSYQCPPEKEFKLEYDDREWTIGTDTDTVSEQDI